jgi:hypothetical protein
MKCVVALLMSVLLAQADIIAPSNRVDWVPGFTVGPQMAFALRTNLIDVTQAPYSADNTGTTDAKTSIQAAITAAASNDVVYLPNGTYRLNSGLTIDKSGVTIRGQSTNAILWGTGSGTVLTVGHGMMSYSSFRVYTITNGSARGSTNLVLTSVQNGFGDTISPGDGLIINHATRNLGNESLQIISTANYDGIHRQFVVVHSRNGNTVSITAPLVWDYTNGTVSLSEVSTVDKMRRAISVENLSITLTNSGVASSATTIMDVSCVRDTILTNLNLGFANNYHISVNAVANSSIHGCLIHDALSTGTSHAGILVGSATGLLVENNIFTSDPARSGLYLDPGIQLFGSSIVGNAFFANYFSGNSHDFYIHNTHPMMNLLEANYSSSFVKYDGYYGSASHFTLFRNVLQNTVPMKRFNSHHQIVGNVVGKTNENYVFEKEQSGYGSPYPLFEMGYPHIGNSEYAGVSPPIPWNFPGWNVDGFSGENLTNIAFQITNTQISTNVISGLFTNIPPESGGVYYPIVFQDDVNTNVYHGSLNGGVCYATAVTVSNMTLNASVTVSNGWRVFMAGQNAYGHLQSSNKATHNITGNYVYTNGIGQSGTLAWSSANTNRFIPSSLLYTNGAPPWWGTNRWPAIDPEAVNPVAPIPAQLRNAGVAGGGDTPTARRLRIRLRASQ